MMPVLIATKVLMKCEAGIEVKTDFHFHISL